MSRKHAAEDRRIMAQIKADRRQPGRWWRFSAYDAEHRRFDPSATTYHGYRFDELVVDDWFHIEQMNDRLWWMRVGEHNFWIHVPRDHRRPAQVHHDGLGDMALATSRRRPRRGRGGR